MACMVRNLSLVGQNCANKNGEFDGDIGIPLGGCGGGLICRVIAILLADFYCSGSTGSGWSSKDMG